MAKLHITFVGLGTEQLGVSQLSAIAKREGHTTGLAFSASLFHDRYNLEIPSISGFFDDTHNVIQAIRDQKPDVLAMGAITSTYQWMLDVARQAKEINPNIKTVFGGVHPSAVSDLVIARPHVDYVVVGEGDEAFPQILKQISLGDYFTPIFNTLYKDKNGNIIRGLQKSFLQELDSLPFFDKTLWEDHVRLGDHYITLGSRGCPNRCTFCSNNFLAKLPGENAGKYVRTRSVEHLINELKIAKRRYKIHRIDFADDVFACSKKWLEEFSVKYRKEIGIPYYIFTHPRYMNEYTAKLLKESGCEWIQMGLQSLDDCYKKEILKRNENSEDIQAALDIMHKFRMNVTVDHMLGLPDEPISAQEKARVFYTQTHIKRINTFWTSYLPGTEMMQKAEEKGILTPEHSRKIKEGEDFFYYQNAETIQDKSLIKTYITYEFIFRIMPAFPRILRPLLTFKLISFFPKFLLRPLSFVTDLVKGLLQRNQWYRAYALHNSYHVKRFFRQKFGCKIRPASKIKEDVIFVDFEPHDMENKQKMVK